MTRYSKRCPRCGGAVGYQASQVIRGGYVKMFLGPDFPDHDCRVTKRMPLAKAGKGGHRR